MFSHSVKLDIFHVFPYIPLYGNKLILNYAQYLSNPVFFWLLNKTKMLQQLKQKNTPKTKKTLYFFSFCNSCPVIPPANEIPAPDYAEGCFIFATAERSIRRQR